MRSYLGAGPTRVRATSGTPVTPDGLLSEIPDLQGLLATRRAHLLWGGRAWTRDQRIRD
jgi:hypothetical protein